MSFHTDEISAWYDSIEDVKVDGYSPIKCHSIFQFYLLRGKTSKLIEDNFEPIPDLKYLIEGTDKRFYLRQFRNYPLTTLYHPTTKTVDFSGDDTAVDRLLMYIFDGKLTLLFTTEIAESVKDTMRRAWKGNTKEPDYKRFYSLFLEISELSIKFEDYKLIGRSLVGYKTVCKSFDDRLNELWKKAGELIKN